MDKFHTLFNVHMPVIGMVHLRALPGTPKNILSVKDIIQRAIDEAELYYEAGIDSLLIENMHDVPYLKQSVGHEISSLMAIIGYELKRRFNIPIGIQILAGANEQALASANSASMDFIRVEGFVFGHVADEGIIESCAGDLLRYRKTIGADNISIFTDIKKKHSSHSITADTNIVDTAKAASFFLSDSIILSGNSTGEEVDYNELIAVKEQTNLPIILGSGVTYENITKFFGLADAVIVGSAFKKEKKWSNDIDKIAVSEFISLVRRLRN